MMNTNSSRIDSNLEEYWSPQRFLGRRWRRWFGISNRGVTDELTEKIPCEALEPEPIDKVREIIKERLLTENKLLFTLAKNQSNLLPLLFLEVGIKQSTAVCRIARYFSLKTFNKLLQEIIESPEAEKYNNREILEEIFVIPPELARIIFNNEDINPKILNQLKALQRISEEQLATINPIAIGTGFLVGGTHLMTNNHVILDEEEAKECVAQFNYVQDVLGETPKIIEYEFDPKIFFFSNESLDYTLVKLKSGIFKRQAGYIFGWFQLIENNANISPGIDKTLLTNLENSNSPIQQVELIQGDRVFIIQHPKGLQKQYVQNDNRVLDYPNGLLKNFLRYTAVSDYGSSGSPVCNSDWELVALHHAAIAKNPDPNSEKTKPEIKAYQGVRICRIVEKLKQQSFNNPKLRSFIEDFVVTSEQLNNPPLPCGLEFDGISDYVSLDGKIALASCATDPFYNDATGTIKFWNQSGVELKTLAHDSVEKLKFSPDGKVLASFGLGTDSFKLWKVEDGTLLKTLLEYNTASIADVSFSPDSTIMVSSDLQDIVKLWRLEDGALLKTIENYGSKVSFSPDSKTLASANLDGIIKLWNLEDHSLINTLTGNSRDVESMIFSPDGKIMASANQDGTIKLWNINNTTLFKTLTGHKLAVLSVKFSQNSETLTSVDGNNIVNIWRLDGQLINTVKLNDFEGQSFLIKGVYFSPSGKTLASINDGGIVKLWRVKDGAMIRSFRHTVSSFKNNDKDSDTSFSADVSFNREFNQDLNIDDEQSVDVFKSITVEAWISPIDGGGTIVSSLPSISKRESQSFSLSVRTRGRNLEKGKGIIDFQVSLPNGEATWSVYVDINKFIHVAAVYDGSAINNDQKRAIYIDGQKQKDYASDPTSSISTNNNPVFPIVALIGASSEKYNTNQNLNNFFKGFMAEVRQWKVPRTEAQIKENMHRRLRGDEEGLVGYWRLEEGESDRAYNLVSNGKALNNRYGIICGTKKWFVASQPPSLELPFVMKFNEENNYIDCGKTNLDTSNAITVEAWVKHKFGNCLIVSRYSQDEGGYSLSWHNGKIRVKLQSKSISQTTEVVTNNNAPADYVWHHVAFTWAQASQEVSIYIDGRQQNTVMIEGRYKSIVFEKQYRNIGLFAGSLDSLTSNLYIGRRETAANYADIAIAQVRLWNVARTQNQIKADMNRRIEYQLLNGNKQELEGLIGYWRLDDESEEHKVSRLEPRNLVE